MIFPQDNWKENIVNGERSKSASYAKIDKKVNIFVNIFRFKIVMYMDVEISNVSVEPHGLLASGQSSMLRHKSPLSCCWWCLTFIRETAMSLLTVYTTFCFALFEFRMHHIYFDNKMKNKAKNTTHSEQFQNQISKSQRGKIDTSNIYIHNHSFSLLGTGTPINSGGAKLVLWAQTSPLIVKWCAHPSTFRMCVKCQHSYIIGLIALL